MANFNRDFADKLYQALQNAGFKYTGKMDLSKINVEEYETLSPMEMAKKYAQASGLGKKVHVLAILQDIYNLNKRGEGKYPMMRNLVKNELEYRLYIAAFLESHLITKSGVKAGTFYTWTPKNPPLLSDAETIVDLAKEIEIERLTPREERFIDESSELGLDGLNLKVNPSNDPMKAYLIYKSFRTAYQRENKKKKNGKMDKFSRILSRTKPEPEPEVIEQPEEVIEPTKQAVEEPVKEVNTDMVLFLLQQQNDLYKALIDSKDKYIKILEQKLLDRQ